MAVEWLLAVAVLLVPVLLLTASLPTWVERRHAATVAAREAVASIARELPAADPARAELVAKAVALAHGIPPADVGVDVSGGVERADTVTVSVRVRMPALAVPMLDPVAGFTYTARAHRRIDDLRSRT